MVTGSLVGGYLVDVHAALPFAVGSLLAAAGTFCAWRLCHNLDSRDR